jgi:histidyl-tRNA synthetase
MSSSPSAGSAFTARGFAEILFPSIWEEATFVAKSGSEIRRTMYTFPDKKGRSCCLVPEITGIAQELYRARWAKDKPKPYRIFYVSRCYRYDRPQEGRYREFTQLGIEIMGPRPAEYLEESIEILEELLERMGIEYEFSDSARRGLGYYVGDGFEAYNDKLEGQRQIAGGGCYAEGCGFALGIDRLVLLRR